MSKITVKITKTIQEEQYEPVSVEMSVEKEVKDGTEVKETRKLAEALEEELYDFMGLEDEDEL